MKTYCLMTVKEASQPEPAPEIRRARHMNARYTADDARRWLDKYNDRVSVLKIAKEEGVDPDTVSDWLRKWGVYVKQGSHFVEQPPLRLPANLVDLVLRVQLVFVGSWRAGFGASESATWVSNSLRSSVSSSNFT